MAFFNNSSHILKKKRFQLQKKKKKLWGKRENFARFQQIPKGSHSPKCKLFKRPLRKSGYCSTFLNLKIIDLVVKHHARNLIKISRRKKLDLNSLEMLKIWFNNLYKAL